VGTTERARWTLTARIHHRQAHRHRFCCLQLAGLSATGRSFGGPPRHSQRGVATVAGVGPALPSRLVGQGASTVDRRGQLSRSRFREFSGYQPPRLAVTTKSKTRVKRRPPTGSYLGVDYTGTTTPASTSNLRVPMETPPKKGREGETFLSTM